MELVILARFGKLPDDFHDTFLVFAEAEWLEKRTAKLMASELAEILKPMFGK